MNRSNITSILNLTLAGKVASFENKSQSEAASSAASLSARMARTWTQIFDYGNKLRADTTRPELEREHLLAQFSQAQIKALSPSVQAAMTRLNDRRAGVQERIDNSLREVDSVASIKGMEARQFLRSLSDTERAEVLKDPAMAKAAVCAPPSLSGLHADHYQFVKDGVIAREQPQAVQELADVETGTDMLMMASQALLSSTMAYTDHETMGSRVEAPSQAA